MRNLATFGLFGTKSVNYNLGFKIPDFDGIIGSRTQPVSVGREAQAVDDFASVERVQTLALVQVPKHSSVVLSSTGGQGTIGGDADRVQISGVSDKVVAELAVGQIPDLDKTIPTARDNKGNRLRRRESDTRNPLSVPFRVSTDGVFALSKGVPKTNGSVTGSRHNLTVVDGESDRKDILFVSNKTTSGATVTNVPKTKLGVPTVRRENSKWARVSQLVERTLRDSGTPASSLQHY